MIKIHSINPTVENYESCHLLSTSEIVLKWRGEGSVTPQDNRYSRLGKWIMIGFAEILLGNDCICSIHPSDGKSHAIGSKSSALVVPAW